MKFRMASQLKSPAFKKDAACTLFGAILSFGVFLGTAISTSNGKGWWFDPVVAFCVAVACMWIGLRTMVKNIDEENKWYLPEFWLVEFKDARERKSTDAEGRLSYDMRQDIGQNEI